MQLHKQLFMQRRLSFPKAISCNTRNMFRKSNKTSECWAVLFNSVRTHKVKILAKITPTFSIDCGM